MPYPVDVAVCQLPPLQSSAVWFGQKLVSTAGKGSSPRILLRFVAREASPPLMQVCAETQGRAGNETALALPVLHLRISRHGQLTILVGSPGPRLECHRHSLLL